MKRTLAILVATLAFAPMCFSDEPDTTGQPAAPTEKGVEATEEVKPIRALLITGGGYHDYESQKKILAEGVSKRANVVWTVALEDIKPIDSTPKIYQNADWAEAYDVVVHNECYAAYKNDESIDAIVRAHTESGTAAIMIHCAMHTFRDAKTKEWDKLVGVESRRHGAHYPITVRNLAPEDPIMKGLPQTWTTPKGELYTTSLLPGAKELGVGFKEGEEEKTKQTCIWSNEYGKARIFGTTLGHHNETMSEDGYLDMITKGILWSTHKLNEDGSIAPGYEATAVNERSPVKFQVVVDDSVQTFHSEVAFVAADVATRSVPCCGQTNVE